jgi:prevent-host-death family protein
MGMKVINVFDAKTRLSEILEQVARGEEFILGKYGEPIAVLSPYRAHHKKRKLGSLKGKGKYKMAEDFDAPLSLEYFIGDKL